MSLQNKQHKRADLVAAGPTDKVTKEICEGCHNSKSPFFKEFDFEKRKTEGTHEKFPLEYPH